MTAVAVRPEESALLREAVADFARREVAPRVAEYDREEHLPMDLLERMADLGFFGGVIPVEFGGLGLDYVSFAEIIEEMSRVCQIMGCLMSMPSGLTGAGIARYGSKGQKERWLAPLARGRIFGATAVTEPNSGSDVASMRTTYRREGGSYVITGQKAWISNLDIASFVLTFATSDRAKRQRGVTAFIIPRDTTGLELRPYKDKLGFRPLSTGDVILSDVRVDDDAIVGVEGEGFAVAMTAVERGRLGVAARAVGVAQACLDDTVEYARTRQAFGGAISRFQIVQSKVTDMKIGVTTARSLVRELAEALERGERARQLASMAKMYAADVAFRSASDAAQVFGANAASPEYRIGRLLRDAKILQIVEGSNDLHRALVAELELGLRSKGESLDVGGPA